MEKEELLKEENYLKNVSNEINSQIDFLRKDVKVQEEQISDFMHYIFTEKGSMDKQELESNLFESAMEQNSYERKYNYLKKLYRLRHNPYFGRIDVSTNEEDLNCYIGISYLNDDEKHLIYDWRSPIANLFYEGEKGKCSYIAPEGKIDCVLNKKRQYKIKDDQIINAFDNDTNIDDDVLQQVLSQESSEKMKNIVNTIQKEQNQVIRDLSSDHLIVEGIAGSGKTSVALHRIAYLLYKIPNLRSNNVLIFSPNNIFSIYISNVLPELGEDNTKETTFSRFCYDYVTEYKNVESFSDFISRYYTKSDNDIELITAKLNDDMVLVLKDYVKSLAKSINFTKDLNYSEFKKMDKDTLNYLFKDKYSKVNIMERLDHMAEFICDQFNLKIGKSKGTVLKKLKELLNINLDFKKLYFNLFKSEEWKNYYGYNLSDSEINSFVKTDVLNYEDATLFIFLKGLVQGFPYSNLIEQIVIDEGQDYTKMQYLILRLIFKKASFTILGDCNQTVNPYYKYESLEDIKNVLTSDSLYIKLLKTYRSSKEIIEYSNKILGLDYAVSIRKSNDNPVIERFTDDIDSLKNDIKYLQSKYKKVCIITKDNNECNNTYELLKDEFDITNMLDKPKEYNPNLIIVPSFLAKGLEFDSVIIYNKSDNYYKEKDKYLLYVAITRAMHELIVYNNHIHAKEDII